VLEVVKVVLKCIELIHPVSGGAQKCLGMTGGPQGF
jgi:hypothetical protein